MEDKNDTSLPETGTAGGNGLGYGICNQSVIPVRTEPSDKSEMASQLLFGEHFRILKRSTNDKWLFIENAYDKYTGWIDFKQFKSISKDYYNILNTMEWPISKDLIGLMHGQNKVFPILYGSVLPVYNSGVVVFEGEAFKYQGEVYYPKRMNDFQLLNAVARYYLSAPYLWGGRTSFGIDCSGLVQQVFRICGHKLPRDAWQQAEVGVQIAFSEIQPGDLAFFRNQDDNIVHVGIITENSHILHASGEVRIDLINQHGIFNADLQEHTHVLHSLRRIFDQ